MDAPVRLNIIGLDDPGPELTINAVCQGCGELLSTQTFDARKHRPEYAAAEARRAAALVVDHKCPEEAR